MNVKDNITIKGVRNLADLKKQLLGQLTVMEILGALTDGLYDQYGQSENRPPAASRRWDELLDLMYHFDGGEDRRQDESPKINPLTLISRLKKEGIIGRDEAQALSDRFNERVRGVLGMDLTEKQIQALFTLFRDFDISQEQESLKPENP